MGFLVSPGVEVKEIDLTNVIPALSTSIGGFAGEFKWGPVDELITVSSENDLAEVFGKPDATVSKSFLQAAGFLKYGNTLKVSRAVTPLSAGATVASADTISATAGNRGGTLAEANYKTQIKNLTDFYAKQSALNKGVTFVARCPGEYGNSLKVIVSHGTNGYAAGSDTPINLDLATVRANFDAAAGSLNTKDIGGTSTPLADEIHVLIIDEDGSLTGTPNNIVEKYQSLSLLSDSKEADGSSNYYYDVINQSSQYVYVNKIGDATDGLFTGADATIGAATAAIDGNADTDSTSDLDTDDSGYFADGLYVDRLSNGQDGTVGTDGYFAAIDLFEDADTVDVNLLMVGAGLVDGDSQISIDNDLISCASTRKDCVAFVSPNVGAGDATTATDADAVEKATTEADKLKRVLAKRNALTNMNSYSFMDSSPIYVYNKYADNYEYIAASGHMAGLCARTDGTNDPWFSPAGYNRGNLLSVTKLAFNPNQSSRDSLYKAQINPVCSFPGQGILLFGDKTGQVKASAFDRINVRRLFIVLEKAISTASKFSLFELNDEFTRAQFRNLVEPFLRDVKGRRGVTDFLVVCDETNNTGQVIDTNRFVADIYIKPARSINFITLNFVATRTGVEFSEVVGG